MLIVFPIGLWIFSLACDLIRLAGGTRDAWFIVAFYTMVGGLIGARRGNTGIYRFALLQGGRSAG